MIEEICQENKTTMNNPANNGRDSKSMKPH
jgi:hypothetical protein